eukprot:jgi/Pico_ML_1/52984/g3608.t2
MENVLVTGVAGFVGSHFARRILHASSVKTVVGVDKMSTTSSWNNLQELQRQERPSATKTWPTVQISRSTTSWEPM